MYTNKLVDELLLQYKNVLGNHFTKYHNHVYRVFLNCLLLDNEKANENKYAIASVFHDIGIWTNHTIDYLGPSIEQANIYLRANGQQQWIHEITGMIHWHHKISRYKGDHQQTIETFRQADWIDVSLGLLNFGADKKAIENNKKMLPNLGFHFFLAKQLGKNFFRHPTKPLPMFTE